METEVLFAARRYAEVIERLQDRPGLTPREHAQLGVALLRRDGGHGARAAEPHLIAAS